MQTHSKNKLLPHERIQAAWRLLEPDGRGTPASICRRYKMTEQQLKRAVSDFQNCRFTKSQNWNPVWDQPNTIHHVLDTSVMVDIEKGAPKGSDIDLFMDPDFDPVNGLLHKQWSDYDKECLLEGLPYRILEIIRDSRPGDELFQEAMEFVNCPLFYGICKAYGIDREQLLISVRSIIGVKI
tara:strand:- start:288 stop:833 length:546 start_codon:yes stop_codon:yes gene_type:complete